jgi:hypothetical protein
VQFRDASEYIEIPVHRSSPSLFAHLHRPLDGRNDPKFSSLMTFDTARMSHYRLLKVSPLHSLTPNVQTQDTLPILFCHGHRGSPTQANALATLLHGEYGALKQGLHDHELAWRQWKQDWRADAGGVTTNFGWVEFAANATNQVDALRESITGHLSNSAEQLQAATSTDGLRAYTTYSIDFQEESSAFNVDVLKAQAWFANDAIKSILAKHPKATSVMLVGHSFGGVVSILMPLMINFAPNSIHTIMTLSAPLRQHPFELDEGYTELFTLLHEAWLSDSCDWARKSVADFGASSGATSECKALSNILLVSVHGGGLDVTIRPDLSFSGSSIAKRHGFSISTMALRNAWLQCDHDGIVNCGQVISTLAEHIYVEQRALLAGMKKPQRLLLWRDSLTRPVIFPPADPAIPSIAGSMALPTAPAPAVVPSTPATQMALLLPFPIRVLDANAIRVIGGMPILHAAANNHLHARWDFSSSQHGTIRSSIFRSLRWVACTLGNVATSGSCSTDAITESAITQATFVTHTSDQSLHPHEHVAMPSDLLSQGGSFWLYIVEGEGQLGIRSPPSPAAWSAPLLSMVPGSDPAWGTGFYGPATALDMPCDHASSSTSVSTICTIPSNSSLQFRHRIRAPLSPYLEYHVLITDVSASSSSASSVSPTFIPVVHFSSCDADETSRDCESFFMRSAYPVLRTEAKSGVFRYVFTVHSTVDGVTAPPGVITIIADPTKEYKVQLDALGDIALSQWLHHHSTWGMNAFACWFLYLVAMQLHAFSIQRQIPPLIDVICDNPRELLLVGTLLSLYPLALGAGSIGGLHTAVGDKLPTVPDGAISFSASLAVIICLVTAFEGLMELCTSVRLRRFRLAERAAKFWKDLFRQRPPPLVRIGSQMDVESAPSPKIFATASSTMRRKQASSGELSSLPACSPIAESETPVAGLSSRASWSAKAMSATIFDSERRKRKTSSWDEEELSIVPPRMVPIGPFNTTAGIGIPWSKIPPSAIVVAILVSLVLTLIAPTLLLLFVASALILGTLWIQGTSPLLLEMDSPASNALLGLQHYRASLSCIAFLVFILKVMSFLHTLEDFSYGYVNMSSDAFLLLPLVINGVFAFHGLPYQAAAQRLPQFSVSWWIAKCPYLLKAIAIMAFPVCLDASYRIVYFCGCFSLMLCVSHVGALLSAPTD